MTGFHEVQFPPDISYGASGGPGYATTVVTTVSGHERRNANWAAARGKWNVAHGLKKRDQVAALIAFWSVDSTTGLVTFTSAPATDVQVHRRLRVRRARALRQRPDGCHHRDLPARQLGPDPGAGDQALSNHGSTRAIPVPSKWRVLRVASVALRAAAMPAIWTSRISTGRPASRCRAAIAAAASAAA